MKLWTGHCGVGLDKGGIERSGFHITTKSNFYGSQHHQIPEKQILYFFFIKYSLLITLFIFIKIF